MTGVRDDSLVRVGFASQYNSTDTVAASTSVQVCAASSKWRSTGSDVWGRVIQLCERQFAFFGPSKGRTTNGAAMEAKYETGEIRGEAEKAAQVLGPFRPPKVKDSGNLVRVRSIPSLLTT